MNFIFKVWPRKIFWLQLKRYNNECYNGIVLYYLDCCQYYKQNHLVKINYLLQSKFIHIQNELKIYLIIVLRFKKHPSLDINKSEIIWEEILAKWMHRDFETSQRHHSVYRFTKTWSRILFLYNTQIKNSKKLTGQNHVWLIRLRHRSSLTNEPNFLKEIWLRVLLVFFSKKFQLKITIYFLVAIGYRIVNSNFKYSQELTRSNYS